MSSTSTGEGPEYEDEYDQKNAVLTVLPFIRGADQFLTAENPPLAALDSPLEREGFEFYVDLTHTHTLNLTRH